MKYITISIIICTIAITQSVFAQASFSTKTDFTTGTAPFSVAVGDFNGDGKIDMAVTNLNDNTVSVFLNTTTPGATTPTFSTKTDFATGSLPYSVSIGDFNGDGKLDMAVANYGANTVSVLLNTTVTGATTPSFSDKTDYNTGSAPYSVSIGDFNGDDKLDMAVANCNSFTVSVSLNTTATGAATPSFSDKTDFTTGGSPYSVCIGDFNGDGKLDIAVANQGDNTVSVLLNTTTPGVTTPSFSTKTDFTTGSHPWTVSIGDLNGDGKLDMAVANCGDATISVLLNTTAPGAATPTFSTKKDFITGANPMSVSIGDLNGDGKLDIAAAIYGSNAVSVFLNTTTPGATTPTFSARTDFTTGTMPSSVSIGDFNGDGKNDMAVANHSSTSVSVFLNTTTIGVATPSFSDKSDFTTGTNPVSVSTGDFNGDGMNDIAVTNYNSNTVSVFLNTTAPGATTPSFSTKTDFTTGSSPISVSIGDFNGDGKLDMAVANEAGYVSVLLNTTSPGAATPTFSAKTDFPTGTNPWSVAIGDFNEDGKLDMAVANYSSGTVSVFLNTTAPGATTPSFSSKTDFTTGDWPYSVSIGDLNGDGMNDIAVANYHSNTVSVFLNTTAPGATTPSFSAKTDFTTGGSPYSVSIGDFNGDGKLDMAVADAGPLHTVSVLLNTTSPGATTPSFSDKTDFTTGTNAISVSIGDFNGDGKNDMAVANNGSNTVSVLLNITAPGAATPSFSAKTDFTTGSVPYSVSMGDFNGDGKLDMAVANCSSNTVSVLLNNVVLLLPVELTSFTASTNGSTVMLNWHTATEVNNYGFEIERRAVNSEQSTVNSWQKIGFMKGAGTSNAPKEYSYSDATGFTGCYVYRLKQIDNDGSYKYSTEAEVTIGAPITFALSQNYPNPFNPSTMISFDLPAKSFISLKVFDLLGREVATIVSEEMLAGSYSRIWNASNIPSGIYFYRLQAGSFTEAKKLILLR